MKLKFVRNFFQIQGNYVNQELGFISFFNDRAISVGTVPVPVRKLWKLKLRMLRI